MCTSSIHTWGLEIIWRSSCNAEKNAVHLFYSSVLFILYNLLVKLGSFNLLIFAPHFFGHFTPAFVWKRLCACSIFFRSNCSWYISGITKGNDRSQSIPSRAYDLWPARPFVIVVVYHTTQAHIHKMNNRVLYSDVFFFCSFILSLFLFWMEELIKQTMLIPYESEKGQEP